MTGQPNIDPKTGSLSGLRTTQPEHIICADSIADGTFSMPGRPELALEYDTGNRKDLGPCPHCGQRTSRVWGYAYDSDTAGAAYYVEWTPLHAERQATFDLIIGRWGKDATLLTVKGYRLPSGYWRRAPPSWFKTLPLGQLDQALLSQQRWIETR